MAKLELVDSGDTLLRLRFICEPIGSNYVVVECNDGNTRKTLELAVEPGTDIDIEFSFDYLEAGTEYTVNVWDNYDADTLLATKIFETAASRNKPRFVKHSIKIENGKINCSFEISNLNVFKGTSAMTADSNVQILINGEFIEGWDGEDIDADVEIGVFPRGTLTVTRTYDFPDGEECTFTVTALNEAVNNITGNIEHSEYVYRERILSLPFSWTIPKVAGEKIRLAASEWNSFIERIKKRLKLEGITYGKEFTMAESAGFVGRNVGTAADGLSLDSPKVISKKILCEAVDALNAMLSADERIAYPNGISATFLNTIVDKLNSI